MQIIKNNYYGKTKRSVFEKGPNTPLALELATSFLAANCHCLKQSCITLIIIGLMPETIDPLGPISCATKHNTRYYI